MKDEDAELRAGGVTLMSDRGEVRPKRLPGKKDMIRHEPQRRYNTHKYICANQEPGKGIKLHNAERTNDAGRHTHKHRGCALGGVLCPWGTFGKVFKYFSQVLVFSVLSCKRSLSILNASPSSDTCCASIFFQAATCLSFP